MRLVLIQAAPKQMYGSSESTYWSPRWKWGDFGKAFLCERTVISFGQFARKKSINVRWVREQPESSWILSKRSDPRYKEEHWKTIIGY